MIAQKKFPGKSFLPVLFLILSIPCFVFGQEKSAFSDKAIAATFRTLAKGFVVAVDIDKLKSHQLKKLEKMSQEKFNKQYKKVYPVIRSLPPEFKVAYGIDETMSKDQAIKNTVVIDKPKIYAIIDALPDAVISGLFKDYLRGIQQKTDQSNFVVQAKGLWEKITAKALK